MSAQDCKTIYDGLHGESTEKFLRKNVLLMRFEEEKQLTSSIRQFDFKKEDTVKTGANLYYTILHDNTINGHLQAYYLPWAMNSGYYIILEPSGGLDLMFTATLDGCSVGYVRAGDGAVRFSHHNIQGQDGTDSDAMRRSLQFAERTVHKPEYYAKDEPKEMGGFYVKREQIGFICGVRKPDRWHIYAQVLEEITRTCLDTGRVQPNFKIKEVHEF